METYVTLICRACKTPNSKESKDFLKFYKKQVTVPCDHCNADISVLVNDAFLKNTSTDTKEHTQIFIQNKEIWTSSNLMAIYIKDTEGLGVEKATLNIGINTIGRSPQQETGVNCIRIETVDRSISRSHFTITTERRLKGFTYTVKDNNSSNGTYLNEELLSKYDEVYLEPHDIISIGKIKVMMKRPLSTRLYSS